MSDEQGNAIRGLADQVEYLQRQLKRADEALAASRSQVDEMIRVHDEQTAELARVTEQKDRLNEDLAEARAEVDEQQRARDGMQAAFNATLASERQRSERSARIAKEIASEWRLLAEGKKGIWGEEGRRALLLSAVNIERQILAALAASDAPGTEADAWVVVCNDQGRGDNALFWRPNARGYTTNLDEAGRYTEAEAKRHASYGDEESAYRLRDVLPLARPTIDRDTLRTELRAASQPAESEEESHG